MPLLLQHAAKISIFYLPATSCNVTTQSRISLFSLPETEDMPSENNFHNVSPIAAMFDHISPRYDFLNHLLSLNIDKLWRRKTVKTIAMHHPRQILDLATGTADLAIQLAKTLPESHITGLDLSEKMLEIGKRKIKEQGLENRIHLQQGDAAHLSFAANTFDAVTIALASATSRASPTRLKRFSE